VTLSASTFHFTIDQEQLTLEPAVGGSGDLQDDADLSGAGARALPRACKILCEQDSAGAIQEG
jgi:hypothetical protein